MVRWLRSSGFYFALAALLFAAGVTGILLPRPQARPIGGAEELAELRRRDDLNVLFVLIDTLRADRLGAYGYPRDTSPVIDALSREGIRFAQPLAQSSWTKCSMASLWTGLHPVSTGVLRSPHALPPEATTPAEILRAAGLRTAGLWRNGWVSPRFGFDQGFDLYQRPRPGARLPGADHPNPAVRRLPGSDADLTRSALEFLSTVPDERWFLYVHYMDVHQYAYDEPSALFGTSYSDIYDNSIRWVDRNVGVLLSGLHERDLLDRTLVVVASDHGEAFYEHQIEGHARNVYREVTYTPLVMSLPFRLDPGVVVEAPVENVDIWPTLLDLLGLPALPDAQGRSLRPLILAGLEGRNLPAGDRTLFAYIDQTWGRHTAEPDPLVGVSDGRHRLIHRPRAPEAAQLFDHASDPREQRNLAAERPGIVAALRGQAEAYLARPAASWGVAPEVELDPEELRELRALGYVLEEADAQGTP